MTWAEIQRLKPVAPSLGMMLETTADVPAHAGSPDKVPAVRLQVLEDAGRHAVPFTTGLLVGIGETLRDRAETVFAIRAAHRRHGHVQEVIVQNFRAKDDTAMRSAPDAGWTSTSPPSPSRGSSSARGCACRRRPTSSTSPRRRCCLRAGVDDWGGVSPLTPDHVNPERPWPQVEALARVTAESGFVLRERLTAHPPYLREPWLDPRLAGPRRGAGRSRRARPRGRPPTGLPWQEPDGGLVSSGRTDLHASVDTTGRSADRRSDFDDVYGDWTAVREAGPVPVPRADSDVAAALRGRARPPAALTAAQALALITADGADLDAVCALADDVRRDTVGDDVTYVVNRNVNFTNVCYTGCRFCAFAQRRTTPTRTRCRSTRSPPGPRGVGRRRHRGLHAGRHRPVAAGTAYADLARAVKTAAPGLHLHAYSPMEVVNGAPARRCRSPSSCLGARGGVDSLPGHGGGDPRRRRPVGAHQGQAADRVWVEVVTTAHRLGIPTTSTMMYGHVDQPHHWVAHLQLLARLQDDTGGFTEFVPLPFVHTSAPIYLAGVARPGPTGRDNRAVHAVARLLLHGRIDHVQCSWVKLGPDQCGAVLAGGVDDLGGTLMEETISRMAGSSYGSAAPVEELEAMVVASRSHPAPADDDVRRRRRRAVGGGAARPGGLPAALTAPARGLRFAGRGVSAPIRCARPPDRAGR
jgi:FO synthase